MTRLPTEAHRQMRRNSAWLPSRSLGWCQATGRAGNPARWDPRSSCRCGERTQKWPTSDLLECYDLQNQEQLLKDNLIQDYPTTRTTGGLYQPACRQLPIEPCLLQQTTASNPDQSSSPYSFQKSQISFRTAWRGLTFQLQLLSGVPYDHMAGRVQTQALLYDRIQVWGFLLKILKYRHVVLSKGIHFLNRPPLQQLIQCPSQDETKQLARIPKSCDRPCIAAKDAHLHMGRENIGFCGGQRPPSLYGNLPGTVFDEQYPCLPTYKKDVQRKSLKPLYKV